MPSYRWTCPACGNPNPAEESRCETCGCPVPFTAADVEAYRSQFQAKGGIVQPTASPTMDESDFAVLKFFLAIPLILLGWWPFSRNDSKAKSSNDHV